MHLCIIAVVSLPPRQLKLIPLLAAVHGQSKLISDVPPKEPVAQNTTGRQAITVVQEQPSFLSCSDL